MISPQDRAIGCVRSRKGGQSFALAFDPAQGNAPLSGARGWWPRRGERPPTGKVPRSFQGNGMPLGQGIWRSDVDLSARVCCGVWAWHRKRRAQTERRKKPRCASSRGLQPSLPSVPAKPACQCRRKRTGGFGEMVLGPRGCVFTMVAADERDPHEAQTRKALCFGVEPIHRPKKCDRSQNRIRHLARLPSTTERAKHSDPRACTAEGCSGRTGATFRPFRTDSVGQYRLSKH